MLLVIASHGTAGLLSLTMVKGMEPIPDTAQTYENTAQAVENTAQAVENTAQAAENAAQADEKSFLSECPSRFILTWRLGRVWSGRTCSTPRNVIRALPIPR